MIQSSPAGAELAANSTRQPPTVPVQLSLEVSATASIAIVGGAFSGLWGAIEPKRRVPARDVVLLEMEGAGFDS